MDAAVRLYEPLFGPFTRPDFGDQKAAYRGAEPTSYVLDFAFGSLGGLEIELIQWISGDTPHRDFVQSGREGMHHLRFRVDDLQQWTAKLATAGYEPVWAAQITDTIGFAYFERAGDSLLIELLQLPE
jgi:methylmalonyl-CoA/ethylmalonyl-CoA epimerase